MPAPFDPAPAAHALADAWHRGETLAALPAPPGTASQAQAVARAMLHAIDLPVVGFRAMARGKGAITGPILAPRLLRSGVAMPRAVIGAVCHAAVFVSLAHALPGRQGAMDWDDLAPLLGPMQAALDLPASRLAAMPQTAAEMTADLAWLGHIVLAPARRGATADAGALRVTLGEQKATLDARPLLLLAARAASRAGGLPEGAALSVALPLSESEPHDTIACRITLLGEATRRLA